ncbi:MAG: histidine kinase, partial [Bacteroidota bacterium]
MKRSFVLLLHLGFWACYLLITMIILGLLYGMSDEIDEGAMERTTEIIFYFAWVPSLITFYGFYFWLFPRFVQRRQLGSATLFGVLLAVSGALLGYYQLVGMFDPQCAIDGGWPAFFGAVASMAVLSLIAGFVALLMRGFMTWVEEFKLKDALRQRNQEMEMALIKAQLDPHFLFNTLNNIDVLMLRNATAASTYLNKLSDIMRFMLYETKTAVIPLQK